MVKYRLLLITSECVPFVRGNERILAAKRGWQIPSPSFPRAPQQLTQSICTPAVVLTSLFSGREVNRAHATQERQPCCENYFLCFGASMADEFLEQSLHFSSPTHLGCLALKAASLPSSFASQQLRHPAVTTAQAEGRWLAERRVAWPNLLQRANEDPCPNYTAQLLSLQH